MMISTWDSGTEIVVSPSVRTVAGPNMGQKINPEPDEAANSFINITNNNNILSKDLSSLSKILVLYYNLYRRTY